MTPDAPGTVVVLSSGKVCPFFEPRWQVCHLLLRSCFAAKLVVRGFHLWLCIVSSLQLNAMIESLPCHANFTWS